MTANPSNPIECIVCGAKLESPKQAMEGWTTDRKNRTTVEYRCPRCSKRIRSGTPNAGPVFLTKPDWYKDFEAKEAADRRTP